jgi:uncharacterized membrane protein YdjX (TVP38/TMEM64 family)
MSAAAQPLGEPSLRPAEPRRRWVRLAVLAALLAAAALVAWRLGFFELRHPQHLAAAVRRARAIPAVGPLFVSVYAAVATLGLPATPLTLAGGAIFGTVLGAALNWLGATLGAAGAYWLARLLGRDALRPLLGRWGDRLDALGERAGFSTVFRLRLLPVVPFNVLSFAAGLAGVPFRAYIAATALGIVPGTVVYTYFADSLLAGVEGASRRAFMQVAIAAVLLLAVSFAPALVRRVRGHSATRSTS